MIKQAIIPLAGQGTRLLPLTSVFAKELLPINGKPGIEYIIEECIEAGIKEIIFIISNKKKMIKKYFYSDAFYKNIIKKKKESSKEKTKRLNKENFADGKNPGRKGLSQRVGIPKNATIAQLEKAAKADGEQGRLARWQLNMRRGKKN